MLHACKRLNTEEDRKKLYDIKSTIINNEPILNMIETYFGWSEGNEICGNNIAYIFQKSREVSSRMRKMKGIGDEYVIGEEVICRKYIKTEGKTFNVNFRF